MSAKTIGSESRGTQGRPVALVTGAAKRVGRASALSLARAGCDVIITYKGSEDAAEKTIEDIVRVGGSREVCAMMRLDLGSAEEVEAFGARVAGLPRLDVLVHNASSYDRTPLEAVTADQALAAYRVNALAPLLLSKHLGPLLAKSPMRGGGAIVAMCDIHALGEHGLSLSKDFVAYAMSKSALAELVRSLARELAPRVRVNAVAPGVAGWPESGPEADAAFHERYLKNVPLGRAGTPEECAEVVKWLALEATYLTGEIVRFDGGRNML